MAHAGGETVIAGGGKTDYTKEEIYQWIVDLSDPKKREVALLELRFDF